MFGSSAWGQNNQQQQQQQQGGGLFGGGGGSTFGQQQNTGFGSNTNTGGFGQPQQTNTGGGLFGSSNTNTGGGFGSSSFGATNTTTNAFGARPSFGATGSSTFGGAATNTGGGLFGSNTNTATNAFGANNQQQSGGLFGSRPSGFGGAATSTFGASTNTGGFGATNAQQAAQPSNQVHVWNNNPPPPIPQTGTQAPPYQPTWQRDPSQGLAKEMPAHLFHMITAMEPYRGGSFEELRMLDYQQGRKEPTNQTAQPAAAGFGQATGGFGSTSTGGFGQPAQTSTFGAAKPGGLFGSTGTTGGFGSTSTGTGFGAQANTGGGLFGQNNASTSTGFGAQANTSTGGGLFGQNNQQQANTGSSIFGNANPFGQNNQQQQQQSTGFGGFGATANKPAFGATPAAGGFGSTSGTTNAFGQTSTTGTTTGFGGFGQQNQQQTQPATGGGLFGSTGGGFGQNNTQQPQAGGGLFGQNNTQQQTGGLFGANAAKPAGGLFGSTPAATATTSGFGGFGQASTNTAAPAAGGLFGQTNTATTNTGGGLFGQQPAAAPAATGGGLFGNTATNTGSTSLFGAPKPATPAGGGLFGATAAQPAQPATTGFGAFGQQQNTAAPAAGGGLFGATNTASTAPKPSLFGGGGGGLFGQQSTTTQPAAATGGGLFGASTTAAAPTTSLFGSTTQPAQQQSTLGQSGGLFGSTLGQSTLNQQQQQQPSLTASVDQNPYGRSDLFAYSGQKLELGSTNKKPALPPITASSYRPSPSKGSRLTKLRGFASSVSGSQSSPRASSPGPGSPRASVIGSPAPSDRYKGLTDAALSPNAFIPRPNIKKITIAPSRNTLNGVPNDPLESVLGASALRSSANGSAPGSPADFSARSPALGASSSRTVVEDTPTRRPLQLESSTMRVPGSERPLKKGDYWCRPKLEKLKAMSHEELSKLENFTVGRKGFGEVSFLRPVDLTTVASLNDLLGDIVIVEPLELTVYPDETKKPPRGKGLNVPAEITLENVWANDKATRQPVTDPNDMRYKRHIKRIQSVPETEFISFDDGVWTFRVEHFSKYGLIGSDDEDDEEDEGVASPTANNKSKSPSEPSASVFSEEDEDEDFFPPTKSQYDNDMTSEDHDSELVEDTEMSFDDEDDDMESSIEYEDEEDTDAFRAIKGKLGAQGMQRLREMQSSFFGTQEPKNKRMTLAETKANEIRQALERKRAEAGFESAEEGVARLDDRAVKRASFGEFSRPPQPRQPRKYAKVSLDQSSVAGHEGVRPDAGLALGRSFRCSWGPNGELVHMGKICSPTTEFKSSPDAVVNIQQVDLLAESQAVEQSRAAQLLTLLLEFTEVDVVDDVPEAVTNTDIRFRDFAGLFDSTDRSHEANLWRLGQALFDEIDLKLPVDTPDEVRDRVAEIRRKLSLSKWLEDAVAPAMDADLAKAGDDRPAKVFALLSGNRTNRAMQSALDSNDLRLATLVSQAGSGDEFRDEVRRQLDDWTKYKSNSLIGYTYRKIYALLAGIPDVSPGNPERGADHAADVIVAENLDWKRAFGLYLWHGCPFEMGVSDVLDSYSAALTSAHPPAKPLPPYLEQPDANNRWVMPTEPTDVLFNLIKMYADLTIPLDNIVTARDCGPSPTDVRIPWHLSFLLSQALQKRDFEDREEPDETGMRYSATANQMTESYAAQLEEEGQWTLAAFVLLHLAYPESRRVALKSLLFRHPQPTAAEQMFLVDKLRIPREWLHEARAAHLAAEGNSYSEYRDLIPAGLGNRAQRTLVSKLAPEAVLRDDSTLLRRLCEELEPLNPDGWEYGGKLFLDYLELTTRVKPLLATVRRSGAAPDPHEASELRRLADDIPRVLQLLPALFPNKNDVQQVASLSGMLSQLQALASELHYAGYMPRPPVSNLLLDKDRLHLLQESATESFDQSLQALVC